jgi:hypothetical protein
MDNPNISRLVSESKDQRTLRAVLLAAATTANALAQTCNPIHVPGPQDTV